MDDYVPTWNGKADTLEKFRDDVLIFVASTPDGKRPTCGPKILGRFTEGSMPRALGIRLLHAGKLTLEDGAMKLYDVIYKAPWSTGRGGCGQSFRRVHS